MKVPTSEEAMKAAELQKSIDWARNKMSRLASEREFQVNVGGCCGFQVPRRYCKDTIAWCTEQCQKAIDEAVRSLKAMGFEAS